MFYKVTDTFMYNKDTCMYVVVFVTLQHMRGVPELGSKMFPPVT